ncbi:L,D-transpeptidase [Methylobacterium symbioticum]|uniref:L,D-TPase catalytic domain-containing protein n=1 Tax=Methylobacterium symbioticum TaxID=2584084 RepID=A0A509EMS1_9HYPH|nr:L,D-transpeptidase [Methylobacterium symbioticum]VUD74759.1 hypothetical protein MET9862_05392 [Methylobacterium symbioticum]
MRPLAALLLALPLLTALTPARADVLIRVDKDTQRLRVSVDGRPRYDWAVSTGTARYDTPNGTYRPLRMARTHFSREWDDAPMPHAIFFTGAGHAIHGSGHVSALGRPASHGCVRLAPGRAATLFRLVKAEGMGNTRIVVEGAVPQAVAGGFRSRRGYEGDGVMSAGMQMGRGGYGYGSGYGYGYGYGYGTAPVRRYAPEPAYGLPEDDLE